jgi:hypothetical protein
MEVSGQLHAPTALPPRDTAPDTHWIGGWMGPRAVLNTVAKRKIPSRTKNVSKVLLYHSEYHVIIKYIRFISFKNITEATL